MAKPIPDGFSSVTPHLRVRDGDKAIAFYKKTFGAVELFRMPDPSGKLMHAELRIGNATIMLSDEYPDWQAPSPQSIGGTGLALHIYTEDCDAMFRRAVEAGATALMPPADMFWGDRYGKLLDPFGHEWSIATHLEDVSPEELERRGQQAMKEWCNSAEATTGAGVASA